MARPNILFVNLPSIPYHNIEQFFSDESKVPQSRAMPLGILYLSSYLKKYGNPGHIGLLDYVFHINSIKENKNIDDFVRGCAEQYTNFVPDILAFSVIFSSSHLFFEHTLKRLKEKWPDTTCVIGGTHATNCTQYLLENKNIDYVVRGEGENAFCSFVDQHTNADSIVVKGIYDKYNIQKDSMLELAEHVSELDQIPFPDWSILNMEYYINAKVNRKRDLGDAGKKKSASIMTTRGCPFMCTFCSSHTVHGRKMRFRSVENVVSEVSLLNERYGVNLFIPEDDLFTVKKKRVVTILNGLKNLSIPGFEIQFPNALSINTLDEELLDILIDTGMGYAQLAIESGSKYTQKNIIKKNCDIDKAKHLVKYLRKQGIVVRCFFILGFPGEDKILMEETIKYAKELEADWCSFQIANPLIGSEMYNQFVGRGEISEEPEFWTKTIYENRAFDTKEFSAKELLGIAYYANLDVNFVNNYNLIHGNYKRAIELFEDILKFYPFHIFALYFISQCHHEMEEYGQAEKTMDRIRELIKKDKNARDLFDKYGYLLPELKAFEKVKEC